MKILAISQAKPETTEAQIAALLKDEVRKAWELYVAGTIREIYFRRDMPGAVLILECQDVQEAKEILETLPFVHAGLSEFTIMPLGPFDQFALLFAQE